MLMEGQLMETGAIGIYFLAHQIRISAVFTHVRYFLSHRLSSAHQQKSREKVGIRIWKR